MKNRLDYILLFVVTVLIISGSLFLAALSAPVSFRKFNTTNYFLFHQIIYGLLPGLILGIIFFKIPLAQLKKISPILLLLNLIVLTFVFLPFIGLQLRGASRWINLGIASFQPSEFLKITTILYLAAWLKSQDNRGSKKKYFSKISKKTHMGNLYNYFTRSKEKNILYNVKKTLLPFLFFLGVISLILTLQPDVSTLGVIIFISLLIYFAAGTPIWHSILMILIGMGGLITLIRIEPYRLSRLIVFLKPEIDPMGIGFQMKQALIAVGSGGITGKGLGMSVQKLGFLPEPMSDTIFAVFAEETGFIGAIILVCLFLVFLWLGLRISKLAQDKFCRLAILGITLWITIQAFVNISSIIGILPLTGIPLPFISYGGSHLVAELIGIGILLNISRHSEKF